MHIVQGAHHEVIGLDPDKTDEGYSKLVWDDTRGPVNLRGGKLASLVQLRDGDARTEIQSLDLMTVNFVDLVNEIHRKGFGLNGQTGTDFFVERPFVFDVAGNYDRSGQRRLRFDVALQGHRRQRAQAQGPDWPGRDHHAPRAARET